MRDVGLVVAFAATPGAEAARARDDGSCSYTGRRYASGCVSCQNAPIDDD